MIVEWTLDNFDKEVLNSNIPVVVDFWAPWCGPCKMLAPILENLDNHYNGKIKVVKINVDVNPDLAIKYDVQSIPTVYIFNNWKTNQPLIWIKPITEYQGIIDSMLNSKSDKWSPDSNDWDNIIDIVGKNHFNWAIKSDKLVMVDFWAPWCGPCRMLWPIMENLADKYKDKVILLKINVDEWDNQEIASDYDVTWIPQINFFKWWQMVDSFIWAKPLEDVEKYIIKLVN